MTLSRQAMRVYRRELRDARKLLGACRDCGKFLPGPGKPPARCTGCQEKAAGHERAHWHRKREGDHVAP